VEEGPLFDENKSKNQDQVRIVDTPSLKDIG